MHRLLITTVVSLIVVGAAQSAPHCPPGMASDPLHRCVCPTGKLVSHWLKPSIGDACMYLPERDPLPHTSGGTITLRFGERNGHTVIVGITPSGAGNGDNGGGGSDGGEGDGGKGCGHGSGGNCGVGLGNGGGNGTGNEGNGKGPKGGQVHDVHPNN